MPRTPKKVICSDTGESASESIKECKCYQCATLRMKVKNTKVCTTCNMPRFIPGRLICFKCANPEFSPDGSIVVLMVSMVN